MMSETPIEEGHPTTGIFGAILLLTCTILGAGILTMPDQFYSIGIIPTTLLLIFVAVLNWYSIWMMVEAGDESGSTSYEDLAEKTFPRVGKYINTVFIAILLFGALVAYMDIIAGLLKGVVVGITTHHYWFTNEYVLLLAFTIIFMFPLCMLRNISKLEYSSFIAVFLIAFFTFVIATWGVIEWARGEVPWNTTIYFGFPPGGVNKHPSVLDSIFNVLPTITLAYGCQPNVFSIRSELSNPNKVRTNIFNILTNFLTFGLYLLMGFFGYLCYPDQIPYDGNIINAIPSNVFGTVLRSLFLVAILFHFPCVHYAVRNTIEVTFFSQYGFSWIRHTVMTVTVIGLSMIIAIEIPSLEKVFSLTGSIAAFPVSFIIPAIAYIRLCLIKRPESHMSLISSPQINWMPSNEDDYKNSIPITAQQDESQSWKVIQFIPPIFVIVFSLVAMAISLYASISAFIPQ